MAPYRSETHPNTYIRLIPLCLSHCSRSLGSAQSLDLESSKKNRSAFLLMFIGRRRRIVPFQVIRRVGKTFRSRRRLLTGLFDPFPASSSFLDWLLWLVVSNTSICLVYTLNIRIATQIYMIDWISFIVHKRVLDRR